MNDNWYDPDELEEEQELEASLHRFEQMVAHDGHAFFDEDEYIYIIDHFMAADELEMAKKAIRQSLVRYPDNIPLQLRRVGLLSALQQPEKALRELRRIDLEHPEPDGFSLYEEAVLYLDLQQWNEAEAKFNAVLSLPKEEREEVLQDPNFYNDLSELYAANGNLLQAVTAKAEAIRSSSASVTDLSELTIQLAAEKQLDKALRLFEARTEADPLSAMDWLCLGVIRIEADQFAEAQEALHNVQAICGEPSEATAELALITLLTGSLLAGEMELEGFFASSGCNRDERFCWYSVVAQSAYNRRLFTTCIRFCQKAIDTKAEETYNHILMALALGELEQFEQGLELLEKTLRIEPDNFHAMLLAGKYNMYLERLPEAKSMLQECCNRYPEQDKAWLAYTSLLARSGALDEAISLLNHAVETRNNPEYLYQLANCHFLKGDPMMGRFYLNIAFAENPDGLEEFLRTSEELTQIPEILSFLNEIKY
ncbi:MAG: hypothetical protein J6S82_00145 [Bacteroidales bacterium]|nr:hypothetical protein [Bacteroidales bacterium]